MKKICLIFLLCVFSCQENKSNNATETETKIQASELISKEAIKNLKFRDFDADNQVKKTIGGWEKYRELNNVITDVRAANLSFFKANAEIVAALNNELKSSIPESINSEPVLSRVVALETKMYKLEDEVNLSKPTKKGLLAAVKELLVAFSNLNLQMNKQQERKSQNIQKPN